MVTGAIWVLVAVVVLVGMVILAVAGWRLWTSVRNLGDDVTTIRRDVAGSTERISQALSGQSGDVATPNHGQDPVGT